MDKRDTPLLAPVEDAIELAVGAYIEQLKAEIAALREQISRLSQGEPA